MRSWMNRRWTQFGDAVLLPRMEPLEVESISQRRRSRCHELCRFLVIRIIDESLEKMVVYCWISIRMNMRYTGESIKHGTRITLRQTFLCRTGVALRRGCLRKMSNSFWRYYMRRHFFSIMDGIWEWTHWIWCSSLRSWNLHIFYENNFTFTITLRVLNSVFGWKHPFHMLKTTSRNSNHVQVNPPLLENEPHWMWVFTSVER